VARDDRVDLRAQVARDVHARSGHAGAAVVRGRIGRNTALVQQDDDRLDTLGLKLRDQGVGGLHLVGDAEPLNTRLGDDVGGALGMTSRLPWKSLMASRSSLTRFALAEEDSR
jgi:hypothetical protein